jgi:prepilin-type N-terminal cleavage/methylation domain-containing protein
MIGDEMLYLPSIGITGRHSLRGRVGSSLSALLEAMMGTEANMTKFSKRGRSRGFTLLEALVVVFIVGMVALVSVPEILRTVKMSDLGAVSNDVAAFLQRVPLESQSRGQVMFVRLTGEDVVTLRRSLQMIADTNGNGSLDVGTDAVVQTMEIPDSVSFSRTTVGDVDSAFFASTGSGTGKVIALGVDFRGRTILPGGAQIGGLATVSMLHRDMVGTDADLTPAMDFRIEIGPVWNPRVVKLVKGHDAAFP